MFQFRKVAAGFAACIAMSFFGAGTALASQGCTAWNNSGFNGQITASNNASSGPVSNGPWVVGDTITASGSPAGNIREIRITRNGANLVVVQGSTVSYTIAPGDESSTFGFYINPNANGSGILSLTCVAVVVPSTGPTNSQILDQTIQTFSKVAAQTSSQAAGDATSGAITDAFSDGGTTQFANGQIRTSFAALDNAASAADKTSNKSRDPFDSFGALGYAKAPYLKAIPRERTPWHVWGDARFTGYEDRSALSFDGRQVNANGGISFRFTDNFLAGVLVGYENFRYSLTSGGVPTSLKGEGVSGGGYFGWKFYDRLRVDGMATYGRIDYTGAAGPVTGSFGADRFTGMGKLSGRYGLGTFYIEPSAMVTIASERQDRFVDTAAVAHNNFNFLVGRSSNGATIGTPLAWGNVIVTPTFGAFADYRFGDQTVAAVTAVPTFNNGWSAHVNGGLNFQMPNNITASAGGEYGGLGDTFQYWRAKGSLGVKF